MKRIDCLACGKSAEIPDLDYINSADGVMLGICPSCRRALEIGRRRGEDCRYHFSCFRQVVADIGSADHPRVQVNTCPCSAFEAKKGE